MPDHSAGGRSRQIDRHRESPSLIERIGGLNCVDELAELPTLAMTPWVSFHSWELIGPNDDNSRCRLRRPRLRASARKRVRGESAGRQAGAGAAEWQSEESQFYIVFTTAKAMSPAVRVLIDFLVEKSRPH
ncbi:LysR family transcriptional regulator protein [Rhizobium sp. NXC14]|nr:LysR family transcriptional regulator protein [Rhizobium sp. NXC14]